MSIAITIDDVIRSEFGAPIQQGMDLYYALAGRERLALVSDSEEDRGLIERWLEIEGLTSHVALLHREVIDRENVAQRRVQQLSRLRANGIHPAFWFEANTEAARALFEHGVPTGLVLQPAYARPEFRPDYVAAVTPWAMLAAEVQRQRALRATDTRGSESEL